ncbi:MAG: TetR/AcrR family transcriptional regulator [Proteobacteria bacterium]|nr:TetR/AcrR family transcriptional regulator [Pseudomonadota bacterium]MCP4916540.1 TetR/AcrR family transcriptional regulator [Pseudomonadota bacterium]
MSPLPITSLLKVPRQKRAVEMVHALLDAGIVVLEREGMQGFSTNRVAQVAGASVGSLYQYFANKEALISGIVERGVLAAEDQVRDVMLVDAGPEVLVRVLLRGVIATLTPFQVLLGELLSTAPMLSRGGIMGILEPRLMDATRDYLLAVSDRYRVVGGPAALYAMVSGSTFTLLKWLAERPRHVPEDAIVEALATQMLVHLEPVG